MDEEKKNYCGGEKKVLAPNINQEFGIGQNSRNDNNRSKNSGDCSSCDNNKDDDNNSIRHNKMVREFIEGWDLMQILGEGTFAEVKLLVNRDTGEACAMKEVALKNRPDLQGPML